MTQDMLLRLIPIIVVLVIVQIILIILGLRDLYSRPQDKVRGNKLIWTFVIILVSGGIGAILYFAFGRKE